MSFDKTRPPAPMSVLDDIWWSSMVQRVFVEFKETQDQVRALDQKLTMIIIVQLAVIVIMCVTLVATIICLVRRKNKEQANKYPVNIGRQIMSTVPYASMAALAVRTNQTTTTAVAGMPRRRNLINNSIDANASPEDTITTNTGTTVTPPTTDCTLAAVNKLSTSSQQQQAAAAAGLQRRISSVHEEDEELIDNNRSSIERIDESPKIVLERQRSVDEPSPRPSKRDSTARTLSDVDPDLIQLARDPSMTHLLDDCDPVGDDVLVDDHIDLSRKSMPPV